MYYYDTHVNAVSRNVLVKGGDLPAASDAVDVLFDGIYFQINAYFYSLSKYGPLVYRTLSIGLVGKDFYEFRSSRIKTINTHGTGCTLASSIAAELAKGSSVFSAIKVLANSCILS